MRKIMLLFLCIFFTACASTDGSPDDTSIEQPEQGVQAEIPKSQTESTAEPLPSPEAKALESAVPEGPKEQEEKEEEPQDQEDEEKDEDAVERSYEDRITLIMNGLETTWERAQAIDDVFLELDIIIKEIEYDGRGPFDNVYNTGEQYLIYNVADVQRERYMLVLNMENQNPEVIMNSSGRDIYGDGMAILGQ